MINSTNRKIIAFQFYKVRLELFASTTESDDKILFQFYKVRLEPI